MKTVFQLAALCVIQLVLAAPDRRPCDDEPKPKPKCDSDPMDISFVVDSSSTVASSGFQQSKDFLNSLLKEFQISPNLVRVSVITYGRGVYTTDSINFNTHSNKKDLINAINGIRYRAGDYTDTGAGIDYMLQNQMSFARRNVKRVVVVLTDGDSQEGEKTKAAAERAKNAGLEVYAVGVGPSISMQELFNIASDRIHVIPAPSYDRLQDIIHQLRVKICKEIPEPPCRHTPTELMLVIDSSVSVGSKDFQIGLHFIESVLASYEINPSTIRVAAIMFGYRVYSQYAINFNDYNTAKGVHDAVVSLPWQHGNRTDTGLGIDYMVDYFLPQTRDYAAKVAIVITDGESQETQKTADAAQRARDAGIKMVAVGIGRARTQGGALNMKELEDIAGSKSNVLLADNYDDLSRIRSQLVKETCYQISEGHRVALAIGLDN